MPRSILALLVGLLSAQASAAPLTLTELKAKLRGSSWVAGETKQSKLSAEEKKRLLGVQLEEGFGDYFMPAKPTANRAPAQFDWRNQNGVNYASPILNQGNCGSCVSFAAVGMLETQMNISRGTAFSPWAFSTQHLFACGGGACQKGWTPFAAVEYLKKTGVPDESCSPYLSGGDGLDRACSTSCSDAAQRSIKIAEYNMPSFFWMDPNAVKAALMKGPLMAVMTVYEDFLFYKGGVYKHTTGGQAGGHAVTIEGWNDADNAWIVRNSWGDEWGEKGYFRIAYDDVSGVGKQTFGVVAPPATGFVALGLRDGDVLSGQAKLKVESTVYGTESVEFSLTNQSRNFRSGFITSAASEQTLDTTQFADGVYEMTAVAHHGTAKTSSQVKTVHILNGAVTGSVAITNVQNGATLKGAQTLEITTQSAPVPLSRLRFSYKNVATGEVSTRTSYTVLPNMKMLWRAQLLPVGNYEIKLEGLVGDKVAMTSAPMTVSIQN